LFSKFHCQISRLKMKGGPMTRLRTYIFVTTIANASCADRPATSVAAIHSENSQSRNADETYAEAEARFRRNLSDLNLKNYLNIHSVKSLAGAVDSLDLGKTPTLESYELVVNLFAAVRDLQFLDDPTRNGIKRRSSWLYPDNGCYARADLMIRNSRELGHLSQLAKLFIFGPLEVVTANHSVGVVYWWYHVAPIVQALGTTYVIDPAVDHIKPLPLTQWLERISRDSSELLASLCQSSAYGPFNRCETTADQGASRATEDQASLLDLEWQRLVELGRDPTLELGNSPPWGL
jgi:hypothetical protein